MNATTDQRMAAEIAKFLAMMCVRNTYLDSS